MSNIRDHIVVTGTDDENSQEPTITNYYDAYKFPIAYTYGWQTAAYVACFIGIIIAIFLAIFGGVALFKRAKNHLKKNN